MKLGIGLTSYWGEKEGEIVTKSKAHSAQPMDRPINPRNRCWAEEYDFIQSYLADWEDDKLVSQNNRLTGGLDARFFCRTEMGRVREEQWKGRPLISVL